MDFAFWLHGVLLLIIAIVFRLFRPTGINAIYGYRTKRSMKNEISWKLANDYSSKLLIYFAVAFLLLQFIIWIALGANKTTVIVSSVLLAASLPIVILMTENYLNKNDSSV